MYLCVNKNVNNTNWKKKQYSVREENEYNVRVEQIALNIAVHIYAWTSSREHDGAMA